MKNRNNLHESSLLIRGVHRRWDWAPLALFPPMVIAATWTAPPWVMMWSLAVVLYGGCKWITLRGQLPSAPWQVAGYLLLWPGMDADRFLHGTQKPPLPQSAEWFAAAAKTLLGAVLLWGVTRLMPEGLLQGWTGMIGGMLVLHFGIFHLLSLAWRTVGVPAEPIMRSPAAARTVSELWGERWNRGFHDLAKRYLFAPLWRRFNGTTASLLTFVASGLVHDLVITLPARGGYGLPSLYFLIQGIALQVQRSRFGRRWLTGGWKGRVFTLLTVAAPAPLLFPPPFVERVMLPFLHVIYAL